MRTVSSLATALIFLTAIVGYGPAPISAERTSYERVCGQLREFAASSEHEADEDNAFYSHAAATADCEARVYTMTAEVRPAALKRLEALSRVLVQAVCAQAVLPKFFEYGWQIEIVLELKGNVVWPAVGVRTGDC